MNNDTIKVSLNRQKKEKLVTELKEKVEKSTGMVFANYQGLTHQQLEGLKKNLKKAESEFVAVKNTLLQIALEGKIDAEATKTYFSQPTGAMFIYNDIIDPLKELTKIIKEFKMPIIKFGILDGKFVTDMEVTKIASLPSLPVLRAQLLGQMQAPISGLHRALNWNLQSLVMTLNAVKEKKSASSA
ncbi:MAG TPA: 50S ribosomal protein L10 [Candidatus Sulfotelmatobacter sp.]|jgi:large subunit ribosomal protein L10|nr:50S ribosomal protein L10 [Candidatus Sulfotelmatobacter sp.]